MAQLVILAASNLAVMLLTAWILHRKETGRSPIPSLLSKITTTDDGEPVEPQPPRGRQIV